MNPLKLHLRVFEIHRTILRVVTLRPQAGVRFSSNYFHDTWHILAGHDAAPVLGRLLWGLAFQRHPGTLIMLDRDHLVPTPFEADPPDPILLVPDGLTRIDVDLLRALAVRLRRSPGRPTTVRWHTFGMPAALASETDENIRRRRWDRRGPFHREQMSKRAGFICYTAPPVVLRSNALSIFRMAGSYLPLAQHVRRRSWCVDGEIQVLDDFARDVSTASVARREVLGDNARHRITSDHERRAIYRRAAELRQR